MHTIQASTHVQHVWRGFGDWLIWVSLVTRLSYISDSYAELG